MHRASAYDEKMGPRDVRRSTVLDDGEFAYGVAPHTIRLLDRVADAPRSEKETVLIESRSLGTVG